MDRASLEEKLKGVLSPLRYRHSLGVMNLARELAVLYGVSSEKAALAGLLHDVAREMEPDRLVAMAQQHGLAVSESERSAPVLLHGKVGKLLLTTEWGITDAEVLSAVALHVTGAPEMSLLAQIIFLADFAEPGRGFFSSHLARTLAKSNRVAALQYVFQQVINYLLNHGFVLDVSTVQAWNQLMINGDLHHGRLVNDG